MKTHPKGSLNRKLERTLMPRVTILDALKINTAFFSNPLPLCTEETDR